MIVQLFYVPDPNLHQASGTLSVLSMSSGLTVVRTSVSSSNENEERSNEANYCMLPCRQLHAIICSI